MALIVRCPWTQRPLRAIGISKDPEELKPLFYCDLKHALLHSTFRRVVLRKALNIKFDGRTFSGLLRELDPRLSGYITFRSFEKLLKKDEKLAHSLGLPFVTASASTTMGTRTRSESTLKGSASGGLGASQSAPRLFGETGSLGVGVTQRRLRRELQRTISEKELEREKEARGSGAKAVRSRKKNASRASDKPRRGLLRHEMTELRGAGILLVEPMRTHPPITESQVAWRHPKGKPVDEAAIMWHPGKTAKQ